MGLELYDLHCHLGFMRDAPQVARDAAALGLGVFANTVTPGEHRRLTRELAGAPNAWVGVGLHPWWVADGRADADAVEEAAALAFESPFVGEVGLDFSPSHADPASFDRQRQAFAQLAQACAEGAAARGPKLLSIHSVRAATEVLDTLERTGCLGRCLCIFHWFSGTSDELHRAVRAGCWFSVNEMMLRTRRGREYARQLPADRLLLETDLPPGEDVPFAAGQIVASLERTLARLADIRGTDVRQTCARNARDLLDR